MAAVWATQAPGSIGRTGSVRGIVKYDLGFGSQHFATTNLMGLKQNIFITNFSKKLKILIIEVNNFNTK